MSAPDTRSLQAIRAKASGVLPGGNLGNHSIDVFIREGKGSRVWSEEGKEFIDYLLGSGPMLIGHAHPAVVEAVQAQIARGTTFFAGNTAAIELAGIIQEAMPCAERVRYVSSGTEATNYCMRAARAYRKRDKILKFEGGFHGMNDYALMSVAPSRPGNFPQAAPESAGIPHVLVGEMLIAPFNDAAAATALIEEHRNELAGVVVEPMQRVIPPKPGFLAALRKATEAHGIPLIFDEIVTGFRLAYGGAQEYYGVVPDMCALGKVIGGGFPLAAIAGKAEIMKHFDKQSVGQGEYLPATGTLSGNPVASVAGAATLKVLKEPGTYERLFATGKELMAGLSAALRAEGFKATVVGEPPCFEAYFMAGEASDYRGLLKADAALGKRFTQLLFDRGILKGEAKNYVSTVHTRRDVDETLAAYKDAAKALAAETRN